MADKDRKSCWQVHARVTKYVDIICEGCTEQEAIENPYRCSTDETDHQTVDWDVESIEEYI